MSEPATILLPEQTEQAYVGNGAMGTAVGTPGDAYRLTLYGASADSLADLVSRLPTINEPPRTGHGAGAGDDDRIVSQDSQIAGQIEGRIAIQLDTVRQIDSQLVMRDYEGL